MLRISTETPPAELPAELGEAAAKYFCGFILRQASNLRASAATPCNVVRRGPAHSIDNNPRVHACVRTYIYVYMHTEACA